MANEYRIKQGDTLGRLAKTYGTSVQELAKINGIKNVNMIRAGAMLKLPGGVPITAPIPPAIEAAIPTKAAAPIAQTVNPYVNQNQAQMDQMNNTIMNTKAFSYDRENDPMAKVYEDQYKKSAQAGYDHAYAKTAAQNGGYLSSAAMAAAQGSYNDQMGQLDSVVYPQLLQAARNRWNDEMALNTQKLNMLNEQDNKEYGRWSDSYNREYQVGRDKAGDERNNRNDAHAMEQDNIQNQQWRESFNQSKSQFNQTMTYNKNKDENTKKAAQLAAESASAEKRYKTDYSKSIEKIGELANGEHMDQAMKSLYDLAIATKLDLTSMMQLAHESGIPVSEFNEYLQKKGR